MFSPEFALTPEEAEQFKRNRVVIAHSEDEAREKQTALAAAGFKDSSPSDITSTAFYLEDLLRNWKGRGTPWSTLKDKRVLDLGAGSIYSRDLFGDIWYPHFARLCAVNGAEVIAIDVAPQGPVDKELFTEVRADLVDVILNEGLPHHPALVGREFDVIFSKSTIGFTFAPRIQFRLENDGIHPQELQMRALEQCSVLLAEGGIMNLDIRDQHLNQVYYVKSGGVVTVK